MTRWVRFRHHAGVGFGTLDGETVALHEGDMFESPPPTGETVPLAAVTLAVPCVPSKMIALWNNFHALADKLGSPKPAEPLYFFKSSNSFLAGGQAIVRPRSYDGRIIYEGELGVVIGHRCRDISEDEAGRAIFGYTCVNDVTAVDILNADPTFAQWARAKSFDTFGAFGPAIATDIAPERLAVRTVLNGDERQNYPLADMILPPARIVSLLSREMTLYPGDLICCGTSLGAGSMKAPHSVVEVTIEGIGTLRNTLANERETGGST